MKRLMVSSFRIWLTLVLLCFLAAEASANHLHYVQITDTRYYPAYSRRSLPSRSRHSPAPVDRLRG